MSLLSRLAVQAARAYGMLVGGASTNVSADYLVVAGGGSGGSVGGGGAGGLLTSTATLSTLNTYSITVGAGASGVSVSARGNSGSNSVLSGTGLTTVTSTGGGAGAGESVSALTGGSGGGGGGTVGSRSGALGTSGQGNTGGNGADNGAGTAFSGGGGGGAGAVGSNASSSTSAGNGGNGSASSISGSSVTYAGGGGGGAYLASSSGTAGTGGTGGGGNGGRNGLTATSGTANLGGGGGAAGYTAAGAIQGNAGNGGSGVVIISYTSATPKFVGGTITTSGGKQIHTFTSSGTLSPITPITASYLVVAGGGGGGRQYGGQGGAGGGGAGGLLTNSTTLYSGATYVVTVGAGGAGGSSAGAAPNGSDSVISGTGLTTLTATGGGGGAGSSGSGANGGSGGGGQGEAAPKTGGTGTSGQGNNGGSGVNAGGGGGGASAAGSNAVTVVGGAGGNGTASSISGTSVTYAGGGGGGGYTGAAGAGGTGGGGSGQTGTSTTPAVSGTANLGGGGGGAGYVSTGNYNGGSGGSGVVIISYAGSQVFNGGLVTTSGGNTIHTFTSTGALTPLTNNLNNSLRFRSSASAYLSRTPTIAGSQTTWTWSAWVKRGTLGSQQKLFTAGSSGSLFASFEFIAGDNLQFYAYNGATNAYLVTTQVFRDPSAWYHIVWAIDTTQATAANRMQLFINGNQVTSFSTSTYPSQNFAFPINNSVIHNIGRDNINATNYLDGYMADINFIDGQQLQPYYFGNNDANFVWKPIQYKGTYGTNGFYLTFGNTTSTTTLGYDSSPNGNNWTTNGISLTAGNTYDAMTDVPTNTSATVANYCTLNPLIVPKVASPAVAVINEGNLAVYNSGASNWLAVGSTIGVTSGKWYWEVTPVGTLNGVAIGIHKSDTYFGSAIVGYSGDPDGYAYLENGNKVNNSTGTAYGATMSSGNVIGVALDLDAGTLTYYKNNTSQGTAFTGLSGSFMPASSVAQSCTLYHNFGQRPFSYTPPTGFVALNTYNLSTPTILQGNKYMDATLYTGNGSTQTIVNQGQFKPDFVWVKRRDGAGQDHVLQDSNRGFSGTTKLASSSTAAENTTGGATGSEWGSVTAANSNGFSITASTNGDQVNKNTWTYVGWQWQAGQGSTSSNTQGSITSTVSVNATAGFSVLTYTGNNTLSTIGHGLGASPKFIIVKTRSGTDGWVVYHASLGVQYYSFLNTTDASYNNLANYWGSTAPSSTTFSINAYGGVNTNGATYVAYCWAEIAGFSKFGSATGNGSADGVFCYTGFLPKFILWKKSSGVGDWRVWDTSRSNYNAAQKILYPNGADAEYDPNNGTTNIDVLSNGFKLRSSNLNESAATYIFAAWASNPFKNSNAF